MSHLPTNQYDVRLSQGAAPSPAQEASLRVCTRVPVTVSSPVQSQSLLWELRDIDRPWKIANVPLGPGTPWGNPALGIPGLFSYFCKILPLYSPGNSWARLKSRNSWKCDGNQKILGHSSMRSPVVMLTSRNSQSDHAQNCSAAAHPNNFCGQGLLGFPSIKSKYGNSLCRAAQDFPALAPFPGKYKARSSAVS
ncbi:hypothetical protein COCSUDRAFT_45665 [Coccomyxa subellipsoidea C-169]|uniref:Uncharacterized protein n=1 Tax=Coccomyxa subellipsoidea (strain C-169) TaxID=574566 RepID=I0YI17_COCSC|nr:hypothetical protein COCSUDRAFT_45665 [Coccomyxa subellipsoidea C-169]EIE18036.1 hypothetical protein COCSUDRAFT_45665 [Coccomyxa subellipsoidea C-169]|eukprot:XP_005642580.1 hypothetical protein COCSUDRAFT_45665 [Coccomyxa subellipsoidea C-169]